MSLKIPLRVTISRMQGGSEPTEIRIHAEDDISGTRVFDVRMDLATFADCLTGKGYCHGDGELFTEAPWGKKHEHKTEVVPFDCYGGRDNEAAKKKALKPFEVDGWIGRPEDLTNHHRNAGRGKQNVGFDRYV